jgi:hypothetical protein
LWIGLFVYCGINIFARVKARIRKRTKASVWDRDNSARCVPPTVPSIEL